MAKHMIDISKEMNDNIHDELARFVLDHFDWYELSDDFSDYGDYDNPKDAVEAAIYDMPADRLADAINNAIEEDYWDRDEETEQAAKDIVNRYLAGREGSEEFDSMMDYPMDDIDGLTEAKKDVGKAFGYVMAKHKDLLNKITNKEQLHAFVKELCEPEVDDLEQKMYLEKLLTDITRQSFLKGFEQVYNIILAGEGLRVIPSGGKKRWGESLNWKDIEVSPTDYDCHVENLKEMQNSKIKSQKNWSLRNDSAYFKTQAATSAYGKHVKDK